MEDDKRGPGGEAAGASSLDLAMAQVGDRWTLQVVEALLDGQRRFSELTDTISGLATNVLSARLRRLEGAGLVVAIPYSHRPPRHSYRLTQAGRDLAGAVLLLSRWGSRQAGGEEGGPRHLACGTPLEARWYCPTCTTTTDEPGAELLWL